MEKPNFLTLSCKPNFPADHSFFYVILESQNYPEAHENRVVSTGEGLFKISFQPHPVSVLP